MRKMIDRVAKVIHATYKDDDVAAFPTALSAALVAIAEMRQPTEAMERAGRNAEQEQFSARMIWAAMIDAALARAIPASRTFPGTRERGLLTLHGLYAIERAALIGASPSGKAADFESATPPPPAYTLRRDPLETPAKYSFPACRRSAVSEIPESGAARYPAQSARSAIGRGTARERSYLWPLNRRRGIGC